MQRSVSAFLKAASQLYFASPRELGLREQSRIGSVSFSFM
jgi:hypothetical protein